VLRRRQTILDACARNQTLGASDESTTHGRVLRAAVPMFAEMGFEACTMRHLGTAVNVRPPALYYHFASKEQIFLEAMWLLFGEFMVEVLEPLVVEPRESWLENVVRRHTRFQAKNPERATANDLLFQRQRLASRLEPEQFDEIRASAREYVRLVRDLASAMSGTEDAYRATVDANAIVSICDRTSQWFRHELPMTAEEVNDRTWQAVHRMLSAGP
jgi:AcrR family transcriptional regulator